jgi:hypothetical protein
MFAFQIFFQTGLLSIFIRKQTFPNTIYVSFPLFFIHSLFSFLQHIFHNPVPAYLMPLAWISLCQTHGATAGVETNRVDLFPAEFLYSDRMRYSIFLL